MFLPVSLLFIFSSVFISCQNASDTDPVDAKRIYDDPRCLPGCFFTSITLEKSNLKLFPSNCSTVCAPYGLNIGVETDDLTESQMTETLKNVKNLVGSLTIMRAKFKSCKFFENLESVDCYNTGSLWMIMNNNMTEIGMTSLTNLSCLFHVTHNRNLARLNVPKLIPVQSQYANYSQLNVEFYGNSDDFCVTVEEMMHFTTYDTLIDRFSRTTGRYCEVSNTTIYPQKTCDIHNITLERLETGCVNLVGDLVIEEGDEEFVQKLESVETIFGCLVISGTNLTNTNFLGKLQRVMSITKAKPTILVEYNPNLTNVSFPSLKRVLSTVNDPVQFNNNNQDLLRDPIHCNGILNNLNKDAPWMVKFDGKVCGDIKIAASPTPAPIPASPVKDNSSNGLFYIIALIFEFAFILWD
ncbi:unnamed protein product [Caenorhabditis brenneri]